MWKYVTRRFRDTFERSANHFDKRPTTNVCNTTGTYEERNQRCPDVDVPCRIQAWFGHQTCQKNYFKNNQNTNDNSWNFEQLNRTWIGAITWSSALALGWYTSQFIHLKLKRCMREQRRCVSVNDLLSTFKPYLNSVNNRALFGNSTNKLEKILDEFIPTVHLVPNEQSTGNEILKGLTPTVHLISNEHIGVKEHSGGTSSAESSGDDLGDVLNSIENKLGLAAIENGQHQAGLNLLRSAANRHHAPAMYNLGLCYEMGLGVTTNEKTAMELYKSAAALQHPGALYNLGIYYGQGRGGLPHDLETATRLLRLAAVQGQQDAIHALEALDIEINSPQENIDPPQAKTGDSWQHNSLLHDENMVPAPTILFLENMLFTPTHESKATVY